MKDILHACDVAEDLAIAFGYNNISKIDNTTICNGYQQPINKLTDLIRNEMSTCGYIECLTFALISKDDMIRKMEVEVNDEVLKEFASILKSKTTEFQIFRNSLIPGILKCIEENKASQVFFLL